jgi:glycosyltransferase involved in cell wall biosynthesis
MKNGIAVAYSGVHQAYQLALAAEELGHLDRFYCSVYAANGKWGGLLARLLGADILFSRRVEGLSPEKIEEYLWPLLAHECRARLLGKNSDGWLRTNSWFDSLVAGQLQKSYSSVFVGVETCAAESFSVARDRGMLRVLDCPGIEAEFLDELATIAGAELGLTTVKQADSPGMRERKHREVQLASAILVCSEIQARSFAGRTAPSVETHVIPLWVDTNFWQPAVDRQLQSAPLRVMFAGKINLRKGVPYLVQAAMACTAPVVLTLVGNLDEELRPFLKRYEHEIKVLPPCAKVELRKCFLEHDLLVLPSLGDSFGFIAMEAMACGLPVIVTENCGVPVPDPSWRVPIMDSDAIAERLTLYAQDGDLCHEHGLIAAEFARQFTPERYRANVKKIFRELLSLASMQ